MSEALRAVLDTARRIERYCGQAEPLAPIVIEQQHPSMRMPSISQLMHDKLLHIVPPSSSAALHRIISRKLELTRTRLISDLYDTARCLSSLENFIPGSDRKTVVALFAMYETSWREFCRRVQEVMSKLYEELGRKRLLKDHPSRCSTFSSRAIEVLEKAFSNSHLLTSRECSIVAERAGISHQQVRTWFQNKRNRGGRKKRSASSSALNERVSEQVINGRRIISLPSRGKREVKPLESTDPSLEPPTIAQTTSNSRPIRSLPKRKGLVGAASPSDSLSSLDSIPPAGGFTSPFQEKRGGPTISFPVSTLDTGLRSLQPCNEEQLTESPVEVDSYLLFNSAKPLPSVTLAKTPSSTSIGSTGIPNGESHGGSVDDVENHMLNNFGDAEFMDLINDLFEDAGAGANLDFDLGLETLDASLGGFETFKKDSFGTFDASGGINMDELTAFFDANEERVQEATVVIGETEQPIDSGGSGRSTPSLLSDGGFSNGPTLDIPSMMMPVIAITEPTPATQVASSPPVPDSAASPTPSSECTSDVTVSTAADQLLQAGSPDDFSLVGGSSSVAPTPDAASQSPDILAQNQNAFPYVDHPARAYHYFQPPQQVASASAESPLVATIYEPSAYTPLLVETHSQWIENALPFDNQYNWIPAPQPVFPSASPMMQSEEWVMVPRSSLPASYSGVVIPHEPAW